MTVPTPPSSPRIRAPGASLVVAIDGPAASGKSSTAQWVAQRLGFRHVDSGALYRAATAVALARAGDTFDEAAVLRFVGEISLEPLQHTFAPMWNGEPMEELIRAPEVTRLVSRVAQMRGVREWVDANVRRAAEGRDVVVDGRDIGTVVFPNADLKVFLDRRSVGARAPSALTAAWSRTNGLRDRGGDRATGAARCEGRDSTVQAKDAVLIDTTYLTQAEQVDALFRLRKFSVTAAQRTGLQPTVEKATSGLLR